MLRSWFLIFRARTRRAFRRFTWGGDWALPLPSKIKHNLYWFFFDGLFSSATDNIMVTYLTLYLLVLGATKTQVGILSSISSLSSALILLPGAFLVERIGHRKEITVFFGGGVARLAILALAVLPFFLSEPALVWVAMGFSITRDTFNNLAFPAWMSITGDIVPISGRGRYFGARNFIMGIAGMLVVFVVGEFLTYTVRPLGFQIALGLAFAVGMFSTFSFSRLQDPKGQTPILTLEQPLSLRAIITDMRGHAPFVSLALVMALWNFSVNIASPFFNVYMVENLKFTASMVGITSIVSSVAGLVVQHRAGDFSDRLGPRRVQLISMALIPILPAAWVFITQFWHVVLLNSFGGMLWAAFNLASFNFLLSLTPEAQRARYSAIYQVLITLALAGGAGLGAWLVTQFSYRAIFLGSAVGRLIAGILFARFVFVKESKQMPAAS